MTETGQDRAADQFEELVAGAIAAEEQGPEALAAFLDGLDERATRVRSLLALLRGVPALGIPEQGRMPEQLGDFRLLQRLGGGGMGVVFLAEQVSVPRRVAVKIVRRDLLLMPGTRERFRREIEAVAAVRHPGVVPILAVGEQDELPWFAMEFVAGRSLAEVLVALQGRDAGALRGDDLGAAVGGTTGWPGSWWQTCVGLLLQVAEAIAHAHAHGVVHRDIKPSNIMLTPDGRAVVLDFGLARMRGDARVTRSGAGAGSPLYMSPEQHRGEATDERTDVYSLGVTLAELLTLRPAFAADDSERLRARVLSGEYVPVRTGNRAVPRPLATVVQKALDVDRRQRYADMAAFGNDLQRVLDGAPVAARSLQPWLRAGRLLRRHPVLGGMLLAAVALVLVVPAALYAQQRRSNAALTSARQRADRHFASALDTVERMVQRVGRSEFVNQPGADRFSVPFVREAVDSYQALLQEEPDDLPLRRRHAKSLGLLAVAQERAADVAGAERSFRSSLLECEQLAADPAMAREAALQRVNLGRLLFQHGRVDEGRSSVERAIADLERMRLQPAWPPSGTDLLANALTTLSCVSEMQGRMAEVRGLVTRAYELLRELVQRDDRAEHRCSLAMYASNLALLCRLAGDLGAARRHYREAIAAVRGIDHEARRPGGTTVLAKALAGLADVLPAEARPESEAAVREAVGLVEQQVRDFPATPEFLHHLGALEHNFALLLKSWDRRDEALPLLARAWEHQSAFLLREPQHARARDYADRHLREWGQLLGRQGRFAEAVEVAGKCTVLPGTDIVGWGACLIARIMQFDPGAADHARRRERVIELLQEQVRRGAGTAGWREADELRQFSGEPRFEAMCNGGR